MEPQEIQDLVLRWFYDLETSAIRQDATSSTPHHTVEYANLLSDLREDVASMHVELARNKEPCDPGRAGKPMQDILSANGAVVKDVGGREQLRRLILQGVIEARRRMHQRLGGENPGEIDNRFARVDPDAPPSPPKVVKPLGATIRKLLDQYRNEQASQTLRKKTLGPYDFVVTRFEQIIGADMPITEITRQHYCDFRAKLAKLPTDASKRFRGMSMRQVAKMAERTHSLLASQWPRLILPPPSFFRHWRIISGVIANQPTL